jgi:imidazolonepropionase-like amidohydrolase
MKRLFSIAKLKRSLLALTFCWPAALFAQDELAPVTRTYAITNVNIVQAPGRKIDMGTVVMKDGLIIAVGKNVSIPPEAIIIKADSMYLYAGFIDGLSRAGIVKPKEEERGARPKDPGNPKPEEAGITPQNDVRPSLNPAEKSIEELRNLGFTAAHVVPYGGMMPGNGSIILLGGKSADEMVLVNKSSFYSELSPARGVYPGTVMGVMAKYRELYRQATLSRAYENTYASNRAGIQRPASDRVLEALYPVVDKRQAVLFKAERVVDAQRVLTLQNDLGFSLMLAELKEGWDIINKLKASNAKVFLSLDLPEDKDKKDDSKKDDKKKDDSKKDEVKKDDSKKDELKKEEPKKEEELKTATKEEKAALEKRKAEFMAKYVGQAASFQKAGMKFGFSTLSVKPANIQGNLRRMITAGLPEDAALAALTTTPAELLGLADRLGSVDNGKIANLVISDKPYFNEKAKVRYVFVEGTMYQFEVKKENKDAKKDKDDASAKVDAAGDWTMTTETPDGAEDGKLSIVKDGTAYAGTISGGRFTQPIKLENIKLDGTALSFTFSFDAGGAMVQVEVSVTIEGDTFKGTASVADYGSFPTQGKRNPK